MWKGKNLMTGKLRVWFCTYVFSLEFCKFILKYFIHTKMFKTKRYLKPNIKYNFRNSILVVISPSTFKTCVHFKTAGYESLKIWYNVWLPANRIIVHKVICELTDLFPKVYVQHQLFKVPPKIWKNLKTCPCEQ